MNTKIVLNFPVNILQGANLTEDATRLDYQVILTYTSYWNLFSKKQAKWIPYLINSILTEQIMESTHNTYELCYINSKIHFKAISALINSTGQCPRICISTIQRSITNTEILKGPCDYFFSEINRQKSSLA